jgi:hypothetical protein
MKVVSFPEGDLGSGFAERAFISGFLVLALIFLLRVLPRYLLT